MTNEEQIAALRRELASVETSLAKTETALLTATPEDRMALSAVLIDLRAERTRLQFQLANLEAASVVVGAVAVRGTRRRATPAARRKPAISRSKAKPKVRTKPKVRAKAKTKTKARRTKKAPARRRGVKRGAKSAKRRR